MLRIKNLTKKIGKKVILDNISLDIKQGEILSIVGRNGAGKSTLIRSIVNLSGDYEGSIKLFDKDIKEYKRYEIASAVSYLPQLNNSVADLTVEDIVLLGRYAHNRRFTLADKIDRSIVDNVMNTTSVYHLRDRKISELSGGERQRAYIASSLAQESKILLLDEPSVFLDPKSADEVYSIIQKLNKENNLTVVIVSHDINMLLQMRSRIVGLKDGKLLFDINNCDISSELLDELYDKKFKIIHHPESGVMQIIP